MGPWEREIGDRDLSGHRSRERRAGRRLGECDGREGSDGRVTGVGDGTCCVRAAQLDSDSDSDCQCETALGPDPGLRKISSWPAPRVDWQSGIPRASSPIQVTVTCMSSISSPQPLHISSDQAVLTPMDASSRRVLFLLFLSVPLLPYLVPRLIRISIATLA